MFKRTPQHIRDAVVAEYLQGESSERLAIKYNMHRATVARLIRSAGHNRGVLGQAAWNRVDRVGQQFGRLAVVRRLPSSRPTRWECRCNCGTVVVVQDSNLTNSSTVSCGCLFREQVAERRSQEREAMIGRRFGRLVVSCESQRSRAREAKWDCRCDCGRTAVSATHALRTGRTVSCGCSKREQAADRLRTHGLSNKTESPSLAYGTWVGLKQRCLNPKNPGFANYGGRGITVCESWAESFEAFLADVGERPSLRHSLDRIDNDKGYEPGNCRWATRREQNTNKRDTIRLTHGGRTLSLLEWSDVTGIPHQILYQRWVNNWAEARILTETYKPNPATSDLLHSTRRAISAAKKRCHCPSSREYRWYGARGLTVCHRWRDSVEAFVEDMGVKPDRELTLDRIDNDLGYHCGRSECPDCGPNQWVLNCRWADRKTQAANQRRKSRLPPTVRC